MSSNQGALAVYWAAGGRSPWEFHPDDDPRREG